MMIDLPALLSASPPPHHLIILNQPVDRIPFFRRLYSTSHLIICADGGANRLFDYDSSLIPTAIVGDLDSLRGDVEAYYRSKGVAVMKDPDQYRTDLEKCIAYLPKYAPNRLIVVVGATGGRLDHAAANVNALYKHPELLLVGESSLSLLLEAGRQYRVKALHPSQLCGVIPFGGPARCTSIGLLYDMDGMELRFGGIVSSSNRFAQDAACIEVSAPCVFTVELSPADEH